MRSLVFIYKKDVPSLSQTHALPGAGLRLPTLLSTLFPSGTNQDTAQNMRYQTLSSLLWALVATAEAGDLKDIKHIVMFMQENRAFDHVS